MEVAGEKDTVSRSVLLVERGSGSGAGFSIMSLALGCLDKKMKDMKENGKKWKLPSGLEYCYEKGSSESDLCGDVETEMFKWRFQVF